MPGELCDEVEKWYHVGKGKGWQMDIRETDGLFAKNGLGTAKAFRRVFQDTLVLRDVLCCERACGEVRQVWNR